MAKTATQWFVDTLAGPPSAPTSTDTATPSTAPAEDITLTPDTEAAVNNQTATAASPATPASSTPVKDTTMTSAPPTPATFTSASTTPHQGVQEPVVASSALTVWWPSINVDVTASMNEPLPVDLPDTVFGAIPANLAPAVAYAVLSTTVATFDDPHKCREPIGFPLHDTDAWVIAVPVTVTNDADLIALFSIHTSTTGAPTAYTFSSWVTPADAGELISAYHHSLPRWVADTDNVTGQ